MSRWAYRYGMTDADRERLDQAAAEHGQDERDGAHDDYLPEPH